MYVVVAHGKSEARTALWYDISSAIEEDVDSGCGVSPSSTLTASAIG